MDAKRKSKIDKMKGIFVFYAFVLYVATSNGQKRGKSFHDLTHLKDFSKSFGFPKLPEIYKKPKISSKEENKVTFVLSYFSYA